MKEPSPVERAQWALGEVVGKLQGIANDLERVHDGLPPPPDINERQEHLRPFDVATEVLATIECVLEENLRPLIRILRHAAEVTDAELEAEFRERQLR